ncbi:MAG: HD domain-containing protein [Alphaproteobacteria bacterium]|nr:HD domain-containing protein [Alphaproteobacteria bacterium]
MKKDYPSKEEALKIWLEGMNYRRSQNATEVLDQYHENMYIFHTKTVARMAEKIAAKTVSLNPEKAYVCGLLHDYGRKLDEKILNAFHGLVGYHELNKLGYPEVAKICLTHSFPVKDFNQKIMTYPEDWVRQIRAELIKFNYDDYDKLIQLCDKMATGYAMVSIEHRVESIYKRYNLTQEQFEAQLNEGLELKAHFDKLCGEDVYKVIGLIEDKEIPTLKEAEKIWQEGIDYRRKNPVERPLSFYIEEEYIYHTKSIAEAAKKLAEKTLYLNPERAYIFGLLHDYGKKIDEKISKTFHGRVGYDELMERGYSHVAQICLTHTFPNKNFRSEDYKYSDEMILWIRSKLSEIEYSDYDMLIQLCDKFFEGLTMISIEKRMKHIQERYGLNDEAYHNLVSEGLVLKKFFDEACGEDVYKILGIEK